MSEENRMLNQEEMKPLDQEQRVAGDGSKEKCPSLKHNCVMESCFHLGDDNWSVWKCPVCGIVGYKQNQLPVYDHFTSNMKKMAF
jgi:hypothetical protein